VQVVDVRDLGAWLVRLAESRRTGTLDGVGDVRTWQSFVDEVARGVGTAPELAWVDEARLLELGVEPWAGPGSLPVWLPQELSGTLAHDPEPARAAGLACRPLSETSRDTLAWCRSDPASRVSGVTRTAEQNLLRRASES
jgi:hypothetical protein